MGQLFFGIYYSLSLWYKLTDRTQYGAYISGLGAIVVIILNILLVPKMGYLGASISSLVCFILMVVISYIFGQKFYPVNYPLYSIIGYLFSGIILVYLTNKIVLSNDIFLLAVKAIIFVSYLLIIFFLERKEFKKTLK
jgi:O-antigen/teichoic acid export membrane protein